MVFTHLFALVCIALWQRIRGQGFSRQAAGFLIHWLHQHAQYAHKCMQIQVNNFHTKENNWCWSTYKPTIAKLYNACILPHTYFIRVDSPLNTLYLNQTNISLLHLSFLPDKHFSFQIIQTEILILDKSFFVSNHSYKTKWFQAVIALPVFWSLTVLNPQCKLFNIVKSAENNLNNCDLIWIDA